VDIAELFTILMMYYYLTIFNILIEH